MEYIVYLMLFPIALGLLILTLSSIWKYRNSYIGKSLLWYFIVIFFYLTSNVLELIVQQENLTILFGRLHMVFFHLIPIPWLGFALFYSGVARSRIKGILPFAFLIPGITSFILLSPIVKPLFYMDINIIRMGEYSSIAPSYGPWFWFGGVHFYTLLIFGALMITRFILAGGNLVKRQGKWVLAGVYIPLVVNLLYLLPTPIMVYKDFTPLAFPLSGLCFFIGIYWKKLLQIVPVGRNQVIRDMSLGILIFDSNRILMDFNQKAADYLGLRDTDLGKIQKDIPALNNHLYTVDFDREYGLEREIKHEGYTYHLDIKVQKILHSDRGSLGVLVTLNDVSSRVRLIEEKMNLLKDMHSVNEKLLQANTQLVQKEKLASIGLISAGISHELKNPLSYLLSNYRFIKQRILQMDEIEYSIWKDKYGEDLMDMVEDSQTGLQHMKEVVDNLQIFTHSQSSQERCAFNIHDGIDSSLRLLQISDGSDMRLIRRFGSLPDLSCYPEKLNHAFLNLLKNAQDAACNGEAIPEIGIYTWQKGDNLFCEISNNGTLIDTKLGNKIFEPFFTTKDPGKGTGLGLSIAWDIVVNVHKGSLDYRVDEGLTCFTITLPLVESHALQK